MMSKNDVCVLLPFFLLIASGGLFAEESGLSVWAVDPLTKVFPDTSPSDSPGAVEMQGGRNEYLSGQVAVLAEGELRSVSCNYRPLRHSELDYAIPSECLRWRLVGFIPVTRNTPNTPESNLLRKSPCEIPDPLLETERMDLTSGRTQPIWLTVFVPRDAPPGTYEGQFSVGNDEVSQSLPVLLEVYPFVLPEERHLWVTNWFEPSRIARFHKVQPWSEEHWSLLERYAENMAVHRQNVVLTRPSLIRVFREADGRLSFDYTDFDRWVELFQEAGACGRIEIGHVAHFGEGGWNSKEIVLRSITATDRATGRRISLPPDDGLAPLLGDLQRHLSEKGWLDRAMIHVADEPSLHNMESWRRASEFVHRAAPKLRRIDAIETRDFKGYLEVWVPKLNYLPGWLDEFRAARRKGDEIWFYTCLHPQGYYPNRLLDYPLVGTRILHWINWRHRLDGYLHWGWNFWTSDPFQNPGDRLPPGDSFIVYPGEKGPLDSIRWEMMREGIQDYEEFRLFAEKGARVIERLGEPASRMDPRQRSDEICERIVRSFSDYEKDSAAFRAARRTLLREIATIDSPPLAVVATSPPAETELVPGPIVVEVYGVVEKGAQVNVSGRRVEIKPDGRFAARASLWQKRDTVEIIVEHNGHKKTLQRHFRVKPL
jgi:hypothetical protein